MRYKGKIKNIDRIIISDPSYSEEVKCRYERTNINGKEWNVDIVINEVEEEVTKELKVKGAEFYILMQNKNGDCILKEDGSFSCHVSNELEETRIGMDTACVAIGINDTVDEIKDSIEDWQPECALQTGTDGLFGFVTEGRKEGKINFIHMDGYVLDLVDCEIKDIIEYLTKNLEIEDLTEVRKNEKNKHEKTENEL